MGTCIPRTSPPAPGYGDLGVASDPGVSRYPRYDRSHPLTVGSSDIGVHTNHGLQRPSAFPEYQGTLMASGHDKDSLAASTTGTFTS